jgi:hypothetical protein
MSDSIEGILTSAETISFQFEGSDFVGMGIEECSPGRIAVAGFKGVVFGLVEEDDISVVYHRHLHHRDATRANLLVHGIPIPWVFGSPRHDFERVGTDYGQCAEYKNE